MVLVAAGSDDRLRRDQHQSALIISLLKLGKVAKDRSRLREALQIARDLEQAGRLAPADHDLLEMIAQTIDSLP